MGGEGTDPFYQDRAQHGNLGLTEPEATDSSVFRDNSGGALTTTSPLSKAERREPRQAGIVGKSPPGPPSKLSRTGS